MFRESHHSNCVFYFVLWHCGVMEDYFWDVNVSPVQIFFKILTKSSYPPSTFVKLFSLNEARLNLMVGIRCRIQREYEGIGGMIKLLLSLLRWWLHCAFVRTHRSLQQERVNFTICNLKKWRDFPGGPRVKTSPSNAEGMGSILGQEAKLPHALWPKHQNINWKQYYNKFNKDFKNCPHQKNL